MGVIMFAAIILGMLGPVLLASLIADMTWLRAGVLAVLGLLVACYFVVGNSETFQGLYWKWTLPASPAAEAAFVAAASELYAQRLESGAGNTTELRQAEARLCALPDVADNWVGRVTQVFLNNSGAGASLTVAFWPHIFVRTAFFPDSTGTLIREGTPLFAQVKDLQPGDVVRFSGRIVGHAGACPGDPPVDRNEELRDPEFLFNFARVAREHAG